MTDETDKTDRTDDRRVVAIGVDAGASRTTAVLVTADGKEMRRAEGPGGAMRPGQATRAAGTIVETARRATFGTRVTLPVPRAVVGVAGAGRAPEREQLAAELQAQAALAREVRVMGDVELALHAAFGASPGIVIAAGTGSAAYARAPDGSVHRAGGYGWQLGDGGGGYWLGRRALALVAREQDNPGEITTLGKRVMRALGLGSFDDMVRWATTATPAQVAALAPEVLLSASSGDLASRDAVREAALELSYLVVALARRFAGGEPPQVAATGGLLGPESPLRGALADRLADMAPGSRLREGTLDPALAAARLALADG
jgi:glucosamine kinase